MHKNYASARRCLNLVITHFADKSPTMTGQARGDLIWLDKQEASAIGDLGLTIGDLGLTVGDCGANIPTDATSILAIPCAVENPAFYTGKKTCNLNRAWYSNKTTQNPQPETQNQKPETSTSAASRAIVTRTTKVEATAEGTVIFAKAKKGCTYDITASGTWAPQAPPEYWSGPTGLTTYPAIWSGPFTGMLFNSFAAKEPGGATWKYIGASGSITATADGDILGSFADLPGLYGDNLGSMDVSVRGEDGKNPPTAVATTSTPVIAVGDEAVLDGSQSKDNDENGESITEWQWHFENITTKKSFNVTTTTAECKQKLSDAGEYRVELTVKDNEGESSQNVAYITIKVVKVEFNPSDIKINLGATATTIATITPASAVSDVTFRIASTVCATVDKTKPTSAKETLTLTGVAIGTTTLYADIPGKTVASAAIRVWESPVTIEKLTVSDIENLKVTASNPPDTELVVCETKAGNVKILINAEFSPNNAETRKYVLWKVDGDKAKPSNGKFTSKKMAACVLKPTGDNRAFKVKVGVDINKNKLLDDDEVTHSMTVYVLKVDKLIVTDDANSTVTASNPSDTKLVVCETKTGNATINIEAKFSPDNYDTKKRVLWRVDGNGATPEKGNFETNNPVRCVLTPGAGARSYKVKIGGDANANGSLEEKEVIRTIEVIVAKIDFNCAEATRDLMGKNTFEIIMQPSNVTADSYKIEIRRASENTWHQLSTQKTCKNFTQRVAGKFKLVGKATVNGVEISSVEKDLEVRFPDAATITANPIVEAARRADWIAASGKGGDHCERGAYIYLNTQNGKYHITRWPVGTFESVEPTEAHATDGTSDNLINGVDSYYIGEYHNHTTLRNVADITNAANFPIGPSATDIIAVIAEGVPGLLRDRYANEIIETGHKDFTYGPNRRATP